VLASVGKVRYHQILFRAFRGAVLFLEGVDLVEQLIELDRLRSGCDSTRLHDIIDPRIVAPNKLLPLQSIQDERERPWFRVKMVVSLSSPS